MYIYIVYVRYITHQYTSHSSILDSIVVSIPACHAGDRGSIPRQGELFYFKKYIIFIFLS